MYQTIRVPPPPPPPPPFVDRDRFVAVNWQGMTTNLPKCEKYLVQRILMRGLSQVCSVFPKWDTGNYTYNFKKVLTCHPHVEPARIGQYHEMKVILTAQGAS